MTWKNSGDKVLASDSSVAPSSKLPILAVSHRLTTSEDDFLKQQKERINRDYRQLLPEAPAFTGAILGPYRDSECGRFLEALLRNSSSFPEYASAHPESLQERFAQTQGDPERLEDLKHELAVLAILVASPLFTDVSLEPHAIRATCGADVLCLRVLRGGEPPAPDRDVLVLRTLDTQRILAPDSLPAPARAFLETMPLWPR